MDIMTYKGTHMAKKGNKRILVLGDTHSGHMDGLTHPDWQQTERQKANYDLYLEMLKKYKPFDICICNGDLIDGTDKKGGGTELISTDLQVQCDMAYKAILETKAKAYFVVPGTPYHVGNSVDFEKIIAQRLDAQFVDHLFLEINGKMISAKHKIAGAALYSALAKEIQTNRHRANEGTEPLVDVLVRSHAHRWSQIDFLSCIGMVTPSLMGFSKYGVRQCSGIVNYGIVVIDISTSGKITWETEIAPNVLQYKTLKG